MALAALAGSYQELLQETYNTWQYRRISPEDYLSLLRDEYLDDPYVAKVFGPASAPEYTRTKMILNENLAICGMGIVAAASVFWLRRRPLHVTWAMPLVMVLSFAIYLFVSPWALILAWDEFVGDRILGSAAMSFFLFGAWDSSGSAAVYLHVLTMVVFATLWTIKDKKSTQSRC